MIEKPPTVSKSWCSEGHIMGVTSLGWSNFRLLCITIGLFFSCVFFAVWVLIHGDNIDLVLWPWLVIGLIQCIKDILLLLDEIVLIFHLKAGFLGPIG